MKIEFNLVQNILKTLPIGYYLGRSIPVSLDKGFDSYFIPSEDRIVIGYSLIERAFKRVSELTINDTETIVRGLLYHEISHVILTPPNLKIEATAYYADALNIFEDERIETILQSFYMNVNFKRNVMVLNDYNKNKSIPPKSAEDAFFNLIRFHNGKRNFLERASDIIKRHLSLNASSIDSGEYLTYVYKVQKLYDDVAYDYAHSPKENENNNSNDSNAGSDNNDDKEQDANSTTAPSMDDLISDTEIEKVTQRLDAPLDSKIASISVSQAVKATLDKYYDATLTLKLSQIIAEKLKQKNKNGAAINSYSGRLDVRSVAKRDDYKWWAQQNRNGHVKMYSKVHFNLFLDNSGSFEDNDVNMNRFIQSLIKVVDSDFDFDIITINKQIKEWSNPKEQVFRSSGGTHLKSEINEVIKKHTVARANNYNIVLFDGEARPDIINNTNAFTFFDTPNTIIVTDASNKHNIKDAITKARVIITSDYCNSFVDAILNLMTQVL